jgi:hypothetical protein
VTRAFNFNIPAGGVAEVTFHGTLECYSSTDARTFLDFVTQILTAANQTPSERGPGGLRHRASLERVGAGATIYPTITFNLSSTRTISYARGGIKSVFFKIRKMGMDAGNACYVFNATFSVSFAP